MEAPKGEEKFIMTAVYKITHVLRMQEFGKLIGLTIARKGENQPTDLNIKLDLTIRKLNVGNKNQNE